ncbi:hypothetical protein D2A34_08695 [Clostridium chromiireducens]|uniref:Anti-sigma factor RsgI-like middle domain-containing protein n=1 Tax=Clostridium chromiireducens TaxID=225345 RepID=A0A399IQJ0_9CLOT|nr:hypothetical protein [Clostridium chromiireducens]RII35275.1 hypothetical protein D2A34_08695 [Clostridium chromiireducens]
MDDKLFEELEKLGIADTDLLLNEEMNLSLDTLTRKRIERSVKKKAGFYAAANTLSGRINDYLGGIYMKRKIALALSAVAVLGLGGGGYAYAKTPVAYVSVDINPSVELGVNAFDQVVSVEAYNEDGEKVLEGTDLINTNVDDAVSAVITNAISDGYIEEDDAITTDETATTSAAVEITVSTDKDGIADKLNESLKETADQTLENNNVDAEVETNKVALARRDEARQLGMTPGKLNLIQKLQALDPEIKVEDYKSSSVKDIQKKTKELRKMKTSSETTTGTDTTTSTTTDTDTKSTNTDMTADENVEQDETVSKSSVDSATIAVPGKNKNSSSEKTSNGIIKKEENSTTGSVKKEENSNNGSVKKEENAAKKEEKSGAASEKNSDSSQGKGNSSKSEKSGNGNSSSENIGKGKNN